MTTLNLLDFGARSGGEPAANDTAFAAALASLATTGGRLHVPHGTYHLARPLLLEHRRNLVLSGDGGNFAHPGTRLVYVGEDPAGCLHLHTCIHARFESICFIADGGVPEAIVRIDAVEGGPNAVSCLNNVFDGCTFRPGPGARPNLRGVDMRDAAHTEFRHCWFQTTEIAASIGAPIRHPRLTISNGQCNNTVFDNCLFFADVIGERGTNVTFQHCEFATRSNGDGAKIDFGIGDRAQVCNVAIRDCFAINGQSHRGAFFTQGRGGAGLTMTNSRVRGYAAAVVLDGGGAAMLTANIFEQTGPGAIDVEVHGAPDSVCLQANLHRRTVDSGNKSVVRVPARA